MLLISPPSLFTLPDLALCIRSRSPRSPRSLALSLPMISLSPPLSLSLLMISLSPLALSQVTFSLDMLLSLSLRSFSPQSLPPCSLFGRMLNEEEDYADLSLWRLVE